LYYVVLLRIILYSKDNLLRKLNRNIGGYSGKQHRRDRFFFRFPFFFSRPKVNAELFNPFPFQKRIIRHVEQKPGGKKRTSSRSNTRICIFMYLKTTPHVPYLLTNPTGSPRYSLPFGLGLSAYNILIYDMFC